MNFEGRIEKTDLIKLGIKSLHIMSKTRLSVPHLLRKGEQFLKYSL